MPKWWWANRNLPCPWPWRRTLGCPRSLAEPSRLGGLITLDPGASYEFFGSLIIDNLYEILGRFEGDDLTEVRPGLAATWEVAESEGGSTLSFTHRDATFSSGKPVTAQDVVYSFDRVIGLESPSSFLLTDVAELEVGSTVAIDDRTVQLRLPEGVKPDDHPEPSDL